MSVCMYTWCGAYILLIYAIGLDCLFSPSYVSEWFLMDSRDPATTFQEFYHNFGVVPVKVDLQVRSQDTEYIYPGVKSAQTDNTTPRRGGVYCLYTSEKVNVYGAMHSTSAAAYTVFTGNHSWTPVNKDVSFQGYVRARAWHPEDFPQPTVTFDPISMSSEAGMKYSVVTHGLGYVPAMTIVQMEFVASSSTSVYFEGLGKLNISSKHPGSNDHPSSNPTTMKWGGLVYAVGPSDVRFWIPSTKFKSGPSNIPNGYIWSMCNGWGVLTNACKITNVFVTIRIWDSLESMTLFSQVITAISTLDVSVNHTYVIDNPEFNVDTDIIQVTAVAVDGLNAGYSFIGTGAAMLDTDEGCGGLIYAYTPTTVQLWHPVVTGSYIIKVGPGVGDETNLQYSTVADVNIVIWKGLRCTPPSVVPFSTINSTRRWISYECVPPSVVTSGDLVRTCMDNDTWSGEAPVCQLPPVNMTCPSIHMNETDSCPYPESGINSNINITDRLSGSEVTYTCVTGYVQVDGNISRQCQVDLTWSGSPLVCQATIINQTIACSKNDTELPINETCPICPENAIATCPIPESGTNSIINISDVLPGHVVNYTCLPGYMQVDGNVSRQCLEDLSWTGSPLRCQEKQSCPYPESGINSNINITDMLVGSVVNYTCLSGYVQVDGNISRQCQDDMSWTGSPLTCQATPVNQLCDNNDTATCPIPESGTNSIINISDVLPGHVVNYTCLPGYMQVDGNVSRHCLDDLSWNGSPLLCQEKQSCPYPGSGINSNINITDMFVGSVVTYTCLSGYVQVDGNLSRQCQDDMSWTGSPLICQEKQSCPYPASGINSNINITTMFVASLVTYTCMSGYVQVDGNISRQCQVDMSWTGSPLTCQEKQSCPYPASGINSNINITDMFVGSVVTYTCLSGYVQVDGNISRQCQDDMSWTGSPLTCQATPVNQLCDNNDTATCPIPESGTNSIINISDVLPGHVVNYTCLPGYMQVDGNVSRHCLDDLSWTGSPLLCQEKQSCPYPGSGINSNINITDMFVGSVVTYTCLSGYVQVDGNLSRQCQDDMSWTGSPQICQEKQSCPYPASGINSNINITDTFVGSVVTYTCLSGYVQVDGNISRQCQDDMSWTGSPLTCQATPVNQLCDNNDTATCPIPESGTNSIINISDVLPGHVVNYTCLPGYMQVDGNVSRQCLEDLSWTGSPLLCQEKQSCPYPASGINSNINITDMFVGSVVTYTCLSGYVQVDGNISRQCQDDLSWTGSSLTCQATAVDQLCDNNDTEKQSCPYPESGINSNINITDMFLGSVVNYTCLSGYVQVDGNISRQCQDDLSWTGSPLTCQATAVYQRCDNNDTEKQSCPYPESGTNSNINITDMFVGSVVNYTCLSGYVQVDGNISRRCQDDLSWTGSPLTCQATFINQIWPDNNTKESNLTMAMLIAEEYSTNLTVSLKSTSKYKRSLVSAQDNRPSTLRLGVLGIIILLTNLGIFLINDIIRFVSFMSTKRIE